MAHTNQTANYDLSQFIGTDIPNPLTDYNGDMEKIDVAIKAVADATTTYAGDITALEIQNGSEALTTTAQTLSGAVNELDADTDDLQSRMTVAEGKITADESTLATAVTNISTLAGKVSAIETQNGSEVLTTTASTLSGAINELDAEIGSIDLTELETKVTALETQNGSETLVTTAQTLSGAINELANGGTSGVTRTLLWSNNDTSSAFASQTVTLSSDDYDVLEITIKRTASGNLYTTDLALKGNTASVCYIGGSSSGVVIAQRTFTYVSDTSITVNGGYSINNNSSTNDDTYAIPVSIYGIKYSE